MAMTLGATAGAAAAAREVAGDKAAARAALDDLDALDPTRLVSADEAMDPGRILTARQMETALCIMGVARVLVDMLPSCHAVVAGSAALWLFELLASGMHPDWAMPRWYPRTICVFVNTDALAKLSGVDMNAVAAAVGTPLVPVKWCTLRSTRCMAPVPVWCGVGGCSMSHAAHRFVADVVGSMDLSACRTALIPLAEARKGLPTPAVAMADAWAALFGSEMVAMPIYHEGYATGWAHSPCGKLVSLPPRSVVLSRPFFTSGDVLQEGPEKVAERLRRFAMRGYAPAFKRGALEVEGLDLRCPLLADKDVRILLNSVTTSLRLAARLSVLQFVRRAGQNVTAKPALRSNAKFDAATRMQQAGEDCLDMASKTVCGATRVAALGRVLTASTVSRNVDGKVVQSTLANIVKFIPR